MSARVVRGRWPDCPPPTDEDFRASVAEDLTPKTKPSPKASEDPLAELVGMTDDGGASCREFLGTNANPCDDAPGEGSGTEERSEESQGDDQGGQHNANRDESNDDPFGLTALADLPDIVLRPEDRLWWDAVLVGHVTLIAGQSGVGKTTLMRRIIRAVSTGGELLGWRGPQFGTPVAVFDYETPGIDRKACWITVYDDDLAEVRDVFVSTKIPFLNHCDVDAVIANLHARKVKLLVIDTMARAFDITSENDNAEMSTVVGIVKRIAEAGLAVVVVGHFGKTPAKGLRALRGASAIVAAVDIVVGFTREKEPSEKQRGRGKGRAEAEEQEEDENDGEVPYVLEILKNRTAPESKLRLYRCGDRDFRVAAGAETFDTRAKSQRTVEALVRESGSAGMSTEQVQEAGREPGLSKRTVAAALSFLRAQKCLRQRKRGHYVHVDCDVEEHA